MPLYSFHCADCDTDAELLVGISEDPACPKCGSARFERQMSRIAPDIKYHAIIKSNRAAAAREGHTSNFSKSEGGGGK